MTELAGLVDKSVDHDTDQRKFIIDEDLLTQEQLINTINQGPYKVDLHKDADNIIEEKEIPLCPVCRVAGASVPNTVMRSNLNPDTYKRTII